MTIRLDHIQIAIPKGSDQTCRTFWRDVVGLDEIQKPDALRARGGVWFALDGSELHLGVETPFSPACKAHPGFCVTDIHRLAERLTAAVHIAN